MFEFMYKHKEKFAIISGIITAAFFLWNMAVGNITSIFEKSSNCVATVDKECITVQEFQRGMIPYQNTQNKNQAKLEVLNTLINQALLYHQAKKLGLIASSYEVREAIESDPAFQINGKFDFEKYVDVLKTIGYLPKQYESYIRKLLSVQKYTVLMTNSVYVTDIELETNNIIKNTSLSGELYLITPSDVKESYTPSPKEIEEYYNTHKSEFAVVSNQTPIYWQTTDKNIALKIYNDLKSGQVPKGYKNINNSLPKEVLDRANSLSPQDKIAVLEVKGTIYVLYLNLRSSESYQPLSVVKEDIIKDIIKQRQKEDVYSYSKKIYEDILNNKNVSLKPVVFTNSKLDKLASIMNIPSKDIISLTVNHGKNIFGPYQTNDGYAIIVINQRTIPKNVSFNSSDMRDLVELKSNELMNSLLPKLLSKASIHINKEIFDKL